MACDDGYAAAALVRSVHSTESADALRRVVESQFALIRWQATHIEELMGAAREALRGWEEERQFTQSLQLKLASVKAAARQ